MNTKLLLDNFDLIANAQNGIPKLRQLILQLAVQGKLVPQEKGKTNIHHEEHEEHEGGKGKEKGKATPKHSFQIPATWRWTTLGSVVEYNYGAKTASEQIPADAWLLDLEDIEKDTSRLVQRILF
ncbi:MAG: restriction endonuclease subunit S, partial [FCB group bacterium]|nr:restriction endonuclease subunit S [FCB group bacterium]